MLQRAFSATLLAAALALPGLASPDLTVLVDQRPLAFDQPPIMQEGRVLVPLRGIFENLGADVVYLAPTRSIKATRGSTQVELTLGSRRALIDGQARYLDVPAASYSGRTLVPLRFISEALGAEVDWQAATRTVAITSATTEEPVEARLRVQTVVHSAVGRLSPGDRLEVILTGDPGGKAYFDVLGAFEGVPMREVRPGRYEGAVTVPDDVEVRQATLVGRLVSAGGQETLLEANRSVTFGPTREIRSGLYPAPNSTLSTARPTIQADFNRPIRPETLRLMVDGQVVSGQAFVEAQSVRYLPPFDLSPGRHQVRLEAVDDQGRTIRHQWGFNLVPAGAGYPSQPGVLQVHNLQHGTAVNRVFNLEGVASPYSTVRVLARPRRDLIPGLIGVQGRPLETMGTADASGRFNLQLDASMLPPSTVLQTEVSATDPNGRRLAPVHLDLTLR
jgi:hypothetical protein